MAILDALTIKALGTSTRQQIVKMLSKRPYTASELAKSLGKHVTTIGEHLEVLEKTGLVARKEGNSKWVYYILTHKGEGLMKPNYSWAIVIGSFFSLFIGSYFLYPTASYVMQESKAAVPAAAGDALTVAQEIVGLNIILGYALIGIAILGFAYLGIKHLRAGTLTKR